MKDKKEIETRRRKEEENKHTFHLIVIHRYRPPKWLSLVYFATIFIKRKFHFQNISREESENLRDFILNEYHSLLIFEFK